VRDLASISPSSPFASSIHTPDLPHESPFSTPPSHPRLQTIGNVEGVGDIWEDTSSAGEDGYESMVDITLCASRRPLGRASPRRSSDNQSQEKLISRRSLSNPSKKELMTEEPLDNDSPVMSFGTDNTTTTPSHSPCTSTHEIPVSSSTSPTSIFASPEIKHRNTHLVGLN